MLSRPGCLLNGLGRAERLMSCVFVSFGCYKQEPIEILHCMPYDKVIVKWKLRAY